VNVFLQELWRTGLYKRSQGKITRQVTFAALAVTCLLGFWRLSLVMRSFDVKGGSANSAWWCFALPAVLTLAGWWVAYRVVNWPMFADFLIAVEAEMNKVTWPGRSELTRASLVVLVSIIALGFILAAFDFLWLWIFNFIGIY
jgi:preprotein translocase subunit SecE